MTPTEALQLAEGVVADGFAAHRPALAALFAGARKLGVNETLVAIAAGPDEPSAARLRALGRVVVSYTRLQGEADDDGDANAGPESTPDSVVDLTDRELALA